MRARRRAGRQQALAHVTHRELHMVCAVKKPADFPPREPGGEWPCELQPILQESGAPAKIRRLLQPCIERV